jgi:hypothetical protein
VTGPYRCPTPCDEDCELNGWGCHEYHDERKRWEHDAEACEARMLAGNLRWLLDMGWRVSLGRHPEPRDPVQPWYLLMAIGDGRDMHCLDGVCPGDLAARAVDVARAEAGCAAKVPSVTPGCPGFQWIGQSFATCDGCGRPAWEHEGEMRLREGAKLTGSEDDWELRPWKPGEADAIKRKWGP